MKDEPDIIKQLKEEDKLGKLKSLIQSSYNIPAIEDTYDEMSGESTHAFETPQKRDELKKKLNENDLIILGCGEKTIRFRPPLIISSEEIKEAIEIIDKTLKSI